MDTPFDNPMPDQLDKRTEAFALDLAWGANNGLWRVELFGANDIKYPNIQDRIISRIFQLKKQNGNLKWFPEFQNQVKNLPELELKFLKKWLTTDSDFINQISDYSPELINWDLLLETNMPSIKDLSVWNFVDSVSRPNNTSHSAITWSISSKAFELLKQPAIKQKVFISYRHAVSSTLALAIEARLREKGHEAENIFIDKQIELGADWWEWLKERIEISEIFVLLVDDEIMDSPTTLDEIKVALKSGLRIIPFLHPGVDVSVLPPELKNKQSIICDNTSKAITYETAINQLLNALGYATY